MFQNGGKKGLPPLAARKRAAVSPKRPCSRFALRAAAGETCGDIRCTADFRAATLV
jgi:hypothetical protein